MKIDDVWRSFEKTGSIKKYLEYKNLCKEQHQGVDIDRGSGDKVDKRK